MVGLILLGVGLLIVLIIILSSIKIVNTGYLYVVERFGQFHRIL
ncbi:MAG: SPFH/Band 7/PHB domain protein, partial [Clostridium sp.]|nr:SPFH/Band 7/PHB domain protein [Clostridium sp.]